jgi:CRP/FNR family transcriptional regulator
MRKYPQICDVQSCFLCSGCLPEWREAIAQYKNNTRFRKGAVIFNEGDPVTGMFFVYSGKVKIHMKWGQEKELVVRFAREGDIIGYRGLGKELVYPVSATALEEAVVCFVEIAFFESTLKVNPSFTYELMKFYANELQEAERRIRNLVHMDAKGRIAETLLMLKRTFGVNKNGFIDITLTKQDIASYCGTTYETFSRIAGELERNKIIRTSGKNVAIVKERQLHELILF